MNDNLRINQLFVVQDRWVAITGAASGIGHMIARGCTINGANTILIDVNEDALEKVKAELQGLASTLGWNSLKIELGHGDLSSEEGVKKVVDTIKTSHESLDCLIHCAGIRFMNDITYTPGDGLSKLEAATLSAPYQGWEKVFRVNVLAPYYLTAGLVTLLGAAAAQGDGKGSVIMFSSPASVHNHQFVPIYQTSKAAVDHLVRIMAAEFADFYIRVNAISPGIVPSGMTPDDGTSNLRLAAKAPAGRAGNEEDMVGTALWLMSKAGSFMDEKVIRAEGGRLLILKGVTSNSD
ncbi:hypothetical protein EYB26_009340 [Talaromyces marneffei]|uniref:uncharacterized protein n=1 Tax=Talaromyces marneffei TaxID=37727 RepID=UPI0012A90268|nr:uncharacterized protein EYB26_009340 [Talaromyces marneffei]QGA21629.1 hypothetical protein EYB26_009340 [Talaromyces marneffei]